MSAERCEFSDLITDQCAFDRIDVARCAHCVESHDHGHVCAYCGTAPDDGQTEDDPVRLAVEAWTA